MIILRFGCLSFGRPRVPDQIHCNWLSVNDSFYAEDYPFVTSAVAECVAFIEFIARRADSLHVGCACNAMQRNAIRRRDPLRPARDIGRHVQYSAATGESGVRTRS